LIVALLVFLGGLRVGMAVANTETWGAEPSVGLALLVLGVVWAALAMRRRGDRAQELRDPSRPS
jgi:hypothetical protein